MSRIGIIARCARVTAVLIAVWSTSLPVAASDRISALDARVGGDAKQTRLVVDLSNSIETPRFFTLADPYRVIIDLPQIAFQFSDKVGHEGRGLVSAFRYGLIATGRSRIVIDTAKPVHVENVSVVEASEGQPARLLVDLAPTTRGKFLASVSAPGSEAAPRRKVEAPKAGDTRPVVVIDPGHGGIDSGAYGAGGVSEKSIVLQVAHMLREKLEDGGNYRVVMTREDDTFIPLGERVRIAREAGAQLFMSIHADSLSASNGVRGATIYTLSDRASDAEAASLADKENRSDAIAGVELPEELDDVAGILIDLMQRETRSFSSRLSQSLASSLRHVVRLNKNPQRSAGFRVLRAPDVPSVLVELGYMSSQQDLKLLQSDEWRKKATEAMMKAVDEFFGRKVASDAARKVN
ncbi:N-acetylmuramoyl-L-alanine amidase [Agaricicola taiwanensis]|uniref:N-acetylmuramoyl-L-alanine amidase n=1 Tax=Agaricicola taiwanensis TaxID=591372 RepID=A0A8J2YHV4_9RHOB|nr:N-acetylmuramoyl-L-alanine amidase [Agaricicola taiwanensis]GGE43809.1 N-acetylmuramoyl-L-alanine amidase [Agaricicola taiwanensis]